MNKMRKNEYYSFALHNNIVIMTLFLENSFSLGNYISISNRIKKIPFYYLHFLPISRFKNLDEQYKLLPISKSNLVQREIKHKIVYFQKEEADRAEAARRAVIKKVADKKIKTIDVEINVNFYYSRRCAAIW